MRCCSVKLYFEEQSLWRLNVPLPLFARQPWLLFLLFFFTLDGVVFFPSWWEVIQFCCKSSALRFSRSRANWTLMSLSAAAVSKLFNSWPAAWSESSSCLPKQAEGRHQISGKSAVGPPSPPLCWCSTKGKVCYVLEQKPDLNSTGSAADVRKPVRAEFHILKGGKNHQTNVVVCKYETGWGSPNCVCGYVCFGFTRLCSCELRSELGPGGVDFALQLKNWHTCFWRHLPFPTNRAVCQG